VLGQGVMVQAWVVQLVRANLAMQARRAGAVARIRGRAVIEDD
jgi:hypothetical protein